METSVLKDKIHSLIDNSDEETLQSVYQLLQEADYTDEFKNVLNEEQVEYYRNKEVITKEAMDNLIKAALKK
jgi:predicted house-cleaning noncanonical NTP pyrophosphatase (MazG superfamily)